MITLYCNYKKYAAVKIYQLFASAGTKSIKKSIRSSFGIKKYKKISELLKNNAIRYKIKQLYYLA